MSKMWKKFTFWGANCKFLVIMSRFWGGGVISQKGGGGISQIVLFFFIYFSLKPLLFIYHILTKVDCVFWKNHQMPKEGWGSITYETSISSKSKLESIFQSP